MLKSPVASDSLVEICPSLVCWTVYDASIRTDLTSSALRTPEGCWVIDPAAVQVAALKELLASAPILGILLTNANHERNAHALAESQGWDVYAHEGTRGLVAKNPKHFFRDRDLLRGGVRVISIDGAVSGECCFHLVAEGVLVMGDALINLTDTGFAILPGKYASDPVILRESLRQLLELEFETLAFAHGAPLVRSPKQKLRLLLGVN